MGDRPAAPSADIWATHLPTPSRNGPPQGRFSLSQGETGFPPETPVLRFF
jgi:hypothetical protein